MTRVSALRWTAVVAIVATLGIGVAAMAHEDAVSKTELHCLKPATWYAVDGKEPQPAAMTTIIADIAKRDVVLLGEYHDQEDHHRWQLQVLAALHAQRPDMVIGFESFPRRVQPVLDRWVAGELSVRQFLDEVDWPKVWDLPPEYYLPLFQFARINRIPMIALNVDSKLTKAITAKGWDAVPEDEREGVGRPAPPSKAYREFLFDIYREHGTVAGSKPVDAAVNDQAFGYFVDSQTAWDRAMAEALAKPLAQARSRTNAEAPSPGGSAIEARTPLVVGILGSGHIRYGYGVPHQLRDLGITRIGSLLPLDADTDCNTLRPGLADAAFAIPELPAPPPLPPRLGIRLDEVGGAVTIVEVTPDSLADKTGLKKGDVLQRVAGKEPKNALTVTAAVRLQPAGTWLPLTVKRGDETIEIVVKFPPKP